MKENTLCWAFLTCWRCYSALFGSCSAVAKPKRKQVFIYFLLTNLCFSHIQSSGCTIIKFARLPGWYWRKLAAVNMIHGPVAAWGLTWMSAHRLHQFLRLLWLSGYSSRLLFFHHFTGKIELHESGWKPKIKSFGAVLFQACSLVCVLAVPAHTKLTPPAIRPPAPKPQVTLSCSLLLPTELYSPVCLFPQGLQGNVDGSEEEEKPVRKTCLNFYSFSSPLFL